MVMSWDTLARVMPNRLPAAGLCSLRIFDQIFPHLDGHGYDVLVNRLGACGRGGKGSYKLMAVPRPRRRYIFTSIRISLHLEGFAQLRIESNVGRNLPPRTIL